MTGKTTQTRRIKIEVVGTGVPTLRKISKQLGVFGKTVKRTQRSIQTLSSGFGTLFAALGASIGVREIARSIDSLQLLSDRINVFSESAEMGAMAFEDLFAVAQRTKAPVESLAEVYNRLAIATSQLDISQDQLLGITQALQQSFRLSGSTAQEAAAAAIQFSQGLSSGNLQGQELRSVLEANGVLSRILAEETGKAGKELIEFAAKGGLSSAKILGILAKRADSLNKRADGLGTTIEQSLIVVFDQLRKKLFEVSKEFGIAKKFEALSKFLVKNIDGLVKSLGILAATFTGVGIAAAVAWVIALGPVVLAVGAVAGAVVAFASLVDKPLMRVEKLWLDLKLVMLETDLAMGKFFERATRFFPALNKIAKEGVFNATINVETLRSEISDLKKELDTPVPDKGGGISERLERITGSLQKFSLVAEPIKTGTKGIKDNIAALNDQFRDVGPVKEYLKNLLFLQRLELEVSVAEGNTKLGERAEKLREINVELAKINGQNLTTALAGIEDGAKAVADNIGGIGKQLSGLVQGTFNKLEDQLVNFVTEGKFQFKDFADAVIKDLARVAIRAAIIRPIAQSLAPQANGNAFANGSVVPFASGGVVNSPMLFPMSGKKTGLMGEAGPEAIVPLKRDSSGKLGVSSVAPQVNFTVINQSNADVETRESEDRNGNKQIELLIVDRVNQGFAKGAFDGALNRSFGLNRRGV